MDELKGTTVYCINLDRRIERWQHSFRVLNEAGFQNVQRLAAVDGKELQPNVLPQLASLQTLMNLGSKRETHAAIHTMGAIGCYLSHKAAWTAILEGPDAYGIICEDDIGVRNAGHKNWGNLAAAFEQLKRIRGHFLSVGNIHNKNAQPLPALTPLRTLGDLMGTQMYILSQNGAALLLKHCLPMEVQVDAYITAVAAQVPEFVAFSFKGSPVGTMAFASFATDIQDTCIKCMLPAGATWYIVTASLMVLLALICGTLAVKYARLRRIRSSWGGFLTP